MRNVLWGAFNLIVGGVLLWQIRDGLGEMVIVIEIVGVGVVFAAVLGYAFSHPERFGRKR